jgi:hypothetical protein
MFTPSTCQKNVFIFRTKIDTSPSQTPAADALAEDKKKPPAREGTTVLKLVQ